MLDARIPPHYVRKTAINAGVAPESCLGVRPFAKFGGASPAQSICSGREACSKILELRLVANDHRPAGACDDATPNPCHPALRSMPIQFPIPRTVPGNQPRHTPATVPVVAAPRPPVRANFLIRRGTVPPRRSAETNPPARDWRSLFQSAAGPRVIVPGWALPVLAPPGWFSVRSVVPKFRHRGKRTPEKMVFPPAGFVPHNDADVSPTEESAQYLAFRASPPLPFHFSLGCAAPTRFR